MENLTIGMALVFLVLIFFLGNFKAAIIAAINIPLALCGAFILMKVSDTPANLISLGAIDFGIIIDTTVIVMENIHRHMSSDEFVHESSVGKILRAAQEVGGPMFFSTLIFVIAFLPLFTMRGVEGAIFSPMSHTYAYALGSAILLAVTLTPVLASFAFARGMHDINNPLWNGITRFYHGMFVTVLRWPRLTLAAVVLMAAVAGSTYPRLGGEFLPKLEEGNIWARATMPLTISLDRGARLTAQMRRVFMSFPEVTLVVSQLGRPDDGTETTGFFNIEFSVDLKPQPEWPAGLQKPDLIKQMDDKLQRRGALGSQRHQFGKGIRPRPCRGRAHRQRAGRRDGQGARHRRSCCISIAWPAQSGDQTRPRGCRAVWAERVRRRGDRAGGDRRAGRDPGVRGRRAL
jgi:cobalt-zinc-cadmium resistance protein CzcA